MTFSFPDVDDADIAWACAALGLPKHAFHGADGLDARAQILKCNDTIDVEACPGSGKTTLLVAKLAILARKWPHRSSGICVLSHTNTAREEIEKRLGGTAEGQCLLKYPHFVGTIHGFINEYLAFPWLRSLGKRIERIDDDACLDWRWKRLRPKTRSALEKSGNGKGSLQYIDSEGNLGPISWGKGYLGRNSETYRNMRHVCADSIAAGLHCYNEMFVWAAEMLEACDEAAHAIRCRFPLVFVDEVQDNSELQSALLQKIFTVGDIPSIRQRFGDSNQAIYGGFEKSGASTDVFPEDAIRRDIKNSFRFGPSIAALADPLAVNPQGLVGCGGFGPGGQAEMSGKHALFLFSDDTIDQVLAVYAEYVLKEFPLEEVGAGHFTAVGARHHAEDPKHPPHIVGQYWGLYKAVSAGEREYPKSFGEYLASGRLAAEADRCSWNIVERAGKGLLRLARILNRDLPLQYKRNTHKNVLELIDDDDARAGYVDFVVFLAAKETPLTQEAWAGLWRSVIVHAACSVAGVSKVSKAAEAFLEWTEAAVSEASESCVSADNIFRYPPKEPTVEIHVGSIHSVKGETHTATLVLDTYKKSHHLKQLKPWLLGEKHGGEKANSAAQERLRQHYVAITRASRLLCLAMREDALSENEQQKFKARGWKIGRVGGKVQWL